MVIFGIIERIKIQISICCHFCHHKREFDVILMYSMWMMCFATGTFQIATSTKSNHMQNQSKQLQVKIYADFYQLESIQLTWAWHCYNHKASILY